MPQYTGDLDALGVPAPSGPHELVEFVGANGTALRCVLCDVIVAPEEAEGHLALPENVRFH